MKKQYDYYLVVWRHSNGEEVHSPACFQVGVHPKEYCESVIENWDKKTTFGHGVTDKSPPTSFEIHRLYVEAIPN